MKIDDLINIGIDAETAGSVWEMIDEMKNQHKAEISRLQAELNQVKIDYALRYALENSGVYSEQAVRAMIDFDNIKVENGVVTGIDKELERVKNECPILFLGGEIPRIISATSGEKEDGISKIRTAMGI